jgi:Holliday junction resolvasome RuvABC endonuclease subunit
MVPKESSNLVTLVGIDPGSETLGFAVLFIDIASMIIESSHAMTLTGSKLAGKDSWNSIIHGDRASRIFAHEEKLLELFNYYQPLVICSEAPFINNRFPMAGIALTEVLCGIKSAVIRYDVWKELYVIPPSVVKRAVGAPGNADKHVMKEKVTHLAELNYNGNVPIHLLDEHSIDALAVAYGKFNSLKYNTI